MSTVAPVDVVIGAAAGVTLNAAELGFRKGLIEIATVEGAFVAPKGTGPAAGVVVAAFTDVKLEAMLLTETAGCAGAGVGVVWETWALTGTVIAGGCEAATVAVVEATGTAMLVADFSACFLR